MAQNQLLSAIIIIFFSGICKNSSFSVFRLPFINFFDANCKCKLDTCTVELSESERRSGWKPLASVLGDAAAAFGCVNRVEELVKQFLRGAVAKLLARPSVQFISCSQDILSRESLNGHALRNEGSKQPVVAFVLVTFPRGVGMRKVDCTAPVLDLTERRELRAVVHGSNASELYNTLMRQPTTEMGYAWIRRAFQAVDIGAEEIQQWFSAE